ncbi:MAG: guanylate kinase [Phycisphaerae bacterium]|nr:guanylate kinase [Phycisphaerae bacterium]
MPSDRRGLLLVLAGPSGVGKTTIVHELLRRFDGIFSVSATTRGPGPNEKNGVDYWFLDTPTFERWVAEDRFLETAQVFGRDWYGTPAEPVDRAVREGRLAVLDIDVQGAATIRRKRPGVFGVFILPPSDEELLRRLRARGREDPATIDRRFAEARTEIENAKKPGVFDAFVVNDDLAATVEQVASLVAERLER